MKPGIFKHPIRFEVLMYVTTKNTVFRDVMLYTLLFFHTGLQSSFSLHPHHFFSAHPALLS
jgi:hypothetical protein